MVSRFSKKDILDKIPSEKLLEDNYLFIKDNLLRENISITLRYIAFLTVLQEEFKLKGTIQYNIYKSIILYTASIVESVLLYCLLELKKNGKIKDSDVMKNDWRYSNISIIHSITESENNEQIIAGKRHEVCLKLKKNTQFNEIIRASQKSKVINKELFKRTNSLKDDRNKIHISGLTETDDFFTKRDINKAFSTLDKILKKVKIKLT